MRQRNTDGSQEDYANIVVDYVEKKVQMNVHLLYSGDVFNGF